MLAEEFSQLLQSRHSIRDFRSDPLPGDVLDAILDDARHAPSWSNTRPYVLAVATGERLDRLREAYVAAFDASLPLQHRKRSAMVKAVLTGSLPDGDFKTWGRYHDDLRPRSVKVGLELYKNLGIERGDVAARDAQARRTLEFFDAPAVIWVFVHDSLLPFSAHDAGLMLQSLMLAATARGVSSCCLGVLATWRAPVDAEFVIPPHYKLITGLALGYASDDPVNDFRAEHPPITLAAQR